MQQIPTKQSNTQFQQYVLSQSSQPAQNSRNTVHKSGIGGRLNTKNNNMGSMLQARQNTNSSFSNQHASKSPQKPMPNNTTIFINNMQTSNKGSFSVAAPGSQKVAKKKIGSAG